LFDENTTQFVPEGFICKMLLFPVLATYKLLCVSNTNPFGLYINGDELNVVTVVPVGSIFKILLFPVLATYKLLLLSNANPDAFTINAFVQKELDVPPESI